MLFNAKDRTISRYEAAFWHFLLSLAVFVVLAWLVLFHWFPDFFYAIDGGWEGMRIIIGVDLVLGPTLTLIVFKAGKKGLRLDLTLIGLFQSICLAAGVWVVYSERPTFFVFYENHFYSASADSYARFGATPPDPYKFGDNPPAYVYAKVPDDPIEEANQRRVLFQTGMPYWANAASYVPLAEDGMEQVLASGADEDDLTARDVDGDLPPWLARHGGSFDDYAFVPIHSRYRDAFIGIRKADAKFVDILEIPPPM